MYLILQAFYLILFIIANIQVQVNLKSKYIPSSKYILRFKYRKGSYLLTFSIFFLLKQNCKIQSTGSLMSTWNKYKIHEN